MLMAGDSLLIEEGLLCVAEGFGMLGFFFVAQFVEGFFGVTRLGQGASGVAFILLQVLQGLSRFCHPLMRVLPEGGTAAEAFGAGGASARAGGRGFPKAGLCRRNGCGLCFSLVHGACQGLHRALSGLFAHFQHGGKRKTEFFF